MCWKPGRAVSCKLYMANIDPLAKRTSKRFPIISMRARTLTKYWYIPWPSCGLIIRATPSIGFCTPGKSAPKLILWIVCDTLKSMFSNGIRSWTCMFPCWNDLPGAKWKFPATLLTCMHQNNESSKLSLPPEEVDLIDPLMTGTLCWFWSRSMLWHYWLVNCLKEDLPDSDLQQTGVTVFQRNHDTKHAIYTNMLQDASIRLPSDCRRIIFFFILEQALNNSSHAWIITILSIRISRRKPLKSANSIEILHLIKP